jgi:hypothetical protein
LVQTVIGTSLKRGETRGHKNRSSIQVAEKTVEGHPKDSPTESGRHSSATTGRFFFHGNTQIDANSHNLRGGGGLERNRASGHRLGLSNVNDGGANRSRATMNLIPNVILWIIVFTEFMPARKRLQATVVTARDIPCYFLPHSPLPRLCDFLSFVSMPVLSPLLGNLNQPPTSFGHTYCRTRPPPTLLRVHARESMCSCARMPSRRDVDAPTRATATNPRRSFICPELPPPSTKLTSYKRECHTPRTLSFLSLFFCSIIYV